MEGLWVKGAGAESLEGSGVGLLGFGVWGLGLGFRV